MDSLDWYWVRGCLGLFAMIAWMAALVDCFRRDFGDRRRKLKWLLALIVLSWPAAIVYWFVGRSGTEKATALAQQADSDAGDNERLGEPRVPALRTATTTGRGMRTRRALRRAQEHTGNSN